MLLARLLGLTLCIGLVVSDEPAPVPVGNLTVRQEGFKGLISVTWELDPDSATLYNVTVAFDDEVVASLNETRSSPTSFDLKSPKFEVAYTVEVTPYRSDIKGKPAQANITLQETDNTPVSTPTNFGSYQLGKSTLIVQWEWKEDKTVDDREVSFFVRACEQTKPDRCKHVVSEDPVAILNNVANDSYAVQIYAHTSGINGTDPVKTSAALEGTASYAPWIEPLPAPVKNMKVRQEGFDGTISLTWDLDPDHGTQYNVTVTLDGTLVTSLNDTRDNVTSLDLKPPNFDTAYTVSLTPYRSLDPDVVGDVVQANITLQKTDDTPIPKPTDFEYAKIGKFKHLVQWQWNETKDETVENREVFFFFRACKQKKPDICRHAISYNNSAIVDFILSDSYDVEIYAHTSGQNGADPVKTSPALQDKMDDTPWDYPKPNGTCFPAANEMATLDTIPYEIKWNLKEHAGLINVSVEVWEGNRTDGKLYYRAWGTGNVESFTPQIKYDTGFQIQCCATYDLGLNQSLDQWGDLFEIYTVPGPSNPVGNLIAKQDGTSDKVILTWIPPRVTNGKLKGYDILVKTEKGAEHQSKQAVKSDAVTATVTIKNANRGSVYEIEVIPVNNGNSGGPDIKGQSAICNIILEKDGFPGWATALIVILVLAVVGGAGFYFVKRRRSY